jgi:hypothetical protein
MVRIGSDGMTRSWGARPPRVQFGAPPRRTLDLWTVRSVLLRRGGHSHSPHQSASGLAHSKTWRRFVAPYVGERRHNSRERRGLPPKAFGAAAFAPRRIGDGAQTPPDAMFCSISSISVAFLPFCAPSLSTTCINPVAFRRFPSLSPSTRFTRNGLPYPSPFQLTLTPINSFKKHEKSPRRIGIVRRIYVPFHQPSIPQPFLARNFSQKPYIKATPSVLRYPAHLKHQTSNLKLAERALTRRQPRGSVLA